MEIGFSSNGCFRASQGRYRRQGRIPTKPKSRPIIKGEQKFKVRRDPVSLPKKIYASKQLDGLDLPFAANSFQLWENLRTLRLELGREQNIPAYVIFHDSTLKEMVRRLPNSPQQMRQISGIGQRKLDLYGERFLTLICAYKDNPNK